MSNTSRPWESGDNRCDRCGSESFISFERMLVSDPPEEGVAIQGQYFCGHFISFERMLDSDPEDVAIQSLYLDSDPEDVAIQSLYFCGHHGNKHKAILIEQGWSMEDYSHLLINV